MYFCLTHAQNLSLFQVCRQSQQSTFLPRELLGRLYVATSKCKYALKLLKLDIGIIEKLREHLRGSEIAYSDGINKVSRLIKI